MNNTKKLSITAAKSHCDNAKRWQSNQTEKKLCANHTNEPLALTSNTVCQKCLDNRRLKAGSKPTRAIWEKLLAGEHCRLSKRDIATLLKVMHKLGFDVNNPPSWSTTFDKSTRTPKQTP